MSAAEHPPKQHLADFASGRLAESEASQVVSHLSQCAECEATLDSLEAQPDTIASGLRARSADEPYTHEPALQQAVERAAKLPEDPAAAAPRSPATKVSTGNPVRLGPYRLLAKLGEGGMGAVFKAQHEHLEKLVAIKVLPRKAMQDAAAVARFRREMKAVGALSHVNIVGAHDAGEAQGVHYLVMEYVDGRDLSALVKKQGPLPVEQAVSCILQAARGLAFAHSKGIVHRDIKPANLLVDGEGTVKILDLGLARLDDGNLANAQAGDGLTQTGQVMGTVDYMAPEQAFDTHRADAKADVYSLGCTLYRILTGRNAYAGDTVVQKILAHREQPVPSLCEARPDVPAALDGIYQRMMAKQPENRPTMADVAAELEALSQPAPASAPLIALPEFTIDVKRPAIASSRPPLARAAGARGGKPPLKPLLAGGAAAAFALLGIWVIFKKDGQETGRIYVEDVTSVETAAGNVPPPLAPAESPTASAASAPSPDPRRIGQASGASPSAATPASLPDPAGQPPLAPFELVRAFEPSGSSINAIVYSPDGHHVWALNDRGVGRWEVAAGRQDVSLPVAGKNWTRLDVSADGRRAVIAGYSGQLAVLDLERREVLRTMSVEDAAADLSTAGISLVSDGSRIVSAWSDKTIRLWDAMAGKELDKRQFSGTINSIKLSPDGRLVAAATIGGELPLLDPATLQTVKSIAYAGHFPTGIRGGGLAWSADGRYLLTGREHLGMWDVETLDFVRRFEGHTDEVSAAAFTPDGRHLVSSSSDKTLRLWEVASGREIARQQESTYCTLRLAVSPDGRFVTTGGGRRFAENDGDYAMRLWRLPIPETAPSAVSPLPPADGPGAFSPLPSPEAPGVRAITPAPARNLALYVAAERDPEVRRSGSAVALPKGMAWHEPFTVELWVTPWVVDDPPQDRIIFGVGGSWILKQRGQSRVWSVGQALGDGSGTFNVRGVIEPHRPVHLAAISTANAIRLYVDGTKAGDKQIEREVSAVSGTGSFYPYSPAGIRFDGTLDEIRISTIARYDADFTPARRFDSDEHTWALYHCDEGSGNVLLDSSGHDRHATLSGVTWVPAQ